MSERMTDSVDADGNKVRKVVHDSMLGNAAELCGLLTKLNVTKDPQLEEARRMLETSLVSVDSDDLRKSEAARTDIKQKVDSILKKFDW